MVIVLLLKQAAKWNRILGTSKVTWLGSVPKARQQATAIAKTPQSLLLVCCCTGTQLSLIKLPPNKSVVCSSTSWLITSWYRLSYKFTSAGEHPMEETHTQWSLPVCKICINSLVTTSKFRTGPRVGRWNPSIDVFTLCKSTWACWIMSQFSHPFASRMIR